MVHHIQIPRATGTLRHIRAVSRPIVTPRSPTPNSSQAYPPTRRKPTATSQRLLLAPRDIQFMAIYKPKTLASYFLPILGITSQPRKLRRHGEMKGS